jgi:hypothetical protein
MKKIFYTLFALVYVFISCNKENNNKPAQEIVKPKLTLVDGFYTIYFDSITDSNGMSFAEFHGLVAKRNNKLYSNVYWRNSIYECKIPLCDSIYYNDNMITFYNYNSIVWNIIEPGGIGCVCDSLNPFKIISLYWDNDSKLNGHFESYDFDKSNNKVKVKGHFRFWPE